MTTEQDIAAIKAASDKKLIPAVIRVEQAHFGLIQDHNQLLIDSATVADDLALSRQQRDALAEALRELRRYLGRAPVLSHMEILNLIDAALAAVEGEK